MEILLIFKYKYCISSSIFQMTLTLTCYYILYMYDCLCTCFHCESFSFINFFLLQINKSDGLPDTICRSCNKNLKLLISFRKVCLRSDEISKLKLNKCLNIKPEEVLLDDLVWETEFDGHSPSNVYNTSINAKTNESKLRISARTDSKTDIHLIGNKNSPVK